MVASKASAIKLAQLFESIEKLTKLRRIAIFAGVMALGVGLSFWLLFWPKYGKLETLGHQLRQVGKELARVEKNAAELKSWRNQMNRKQTQYKIVMRALPEKEEIPSLIAAISQAGGEAGVEFLLFKPKPEKIKGFYAEIPVDIDMSGSYHQVALFFDKVSNLGRVVNIRDIKMVSRVKADGGGALKTVCQAVTYKFIQSASRGQ